MRILFITTQLPYPPVSGGVIKSWRLVSHWASCSNVELKLGYFLKGDDAENEADFLSKVDDIGEIRVFSKPLDRPRTALNLIKSYLTAATLNVYRNADKEFGKKMAAWAEDVDIIFVDHYEMAQYVPKNTRAKVVLHEHNAEFVMWDRLAEIEKNPLKRLIIRAEGRRIRATERKYAAMADRVWAAPNDIEELTAIGVDHTKCEPTFHLGEDFMLDWPELSFDRTEKALLFIGTLTWEANVDGLIWFFDRIWPKLVEAEPDLMFYLVGKNPDPRITEKTARDPRVVITGFVEDLAPYYERGRVFVIPLRFGSGIKVKLLNALYRGIPIVTTPIGTEGLDAQSGEELYSSTDPDVQVQSILELLNDRTTWDKMRIAARAKGREYTWEKLLANHDNSLRTLLEEKA